MQIYSDPSYDFLVDLIQRSVHASFDSLTIHVYLIHGGTVSALSHLDALVELCLLSLFIH
jgi:hypothetical protein